MCGEFMRLVTRAAQRARAGTARSPSTHVVSEWICPECDYFEDADDDE